MKKGYRNFTLIELLVAKPGVARRQQSLPKAKRRSAIATWATAGTRARSSSFTLIELLVVIAIIGILAALLLPVLSRAKIAARNVVCISNFRQHGMGLNMYAEDFNSWYYWRYDGASTGKFYMCRQLSRETTFDIHETVESYVSPSDIYNCPFMVPNSLFGSWKDHWPRTGSNAQNDGYQFWTYQLYANYATFVAKFSLPDGTPVSWDQVVPRKLGEAGKEDYPIMADQVTQSGATGLFWNAHSYLFTGDNVPKSEVRGNSLYQDGSVEHNRNDDGKYVRLWTTYGNERLWRPRQ